MGNYWLDKHMQDEDTQLQELIKKYRLDEEHQTWQAAGMFDRHTLAESRKFAIATVLSSQKLLNDLDKESYGIMTLNSRWQRVIIQTSFRVMMCRGFSLWGVQACRAPADMLIAKVEDKYEAFEYGCRTKTLKTVWNEEVNNDLRSCGIDIEAELTCVLAGEIGKEYTEEGLTDIKNNAKTRIKTKKVTMDDVEAAADSIHQQCGHKPNWIMADLDNAESGMFDLQKQSDEFNYTEHSADSWLFSFMGMDSKGRKVYKNPFTTNDVVLGFKGSDYHAGYF